MNKAQNYKLWETIKDSAKELFLDSGDKTALNIYKKACGEALKAINKAIIEEAIEQTTNNNG